MRKLKVGDRVRVYGALPNVTDGDPMRYHGKRGKIVKLQMEHSSEQVEVLFDVDGESWWFVAHQCVRLKPKTKVTSVTLPQVAKAWDKNVAHWSPFCEIEPASVSSLFKSFCRELGIQKT